MVGYSDARSSGITSPSASRPVSAALSGGDSEICWNQQTGLADGGGCVLRQVDVAVETDADAGVPVLQRDRGDPAYLDVVDQYGRIDGDGGGVGHLDDDTERAVATAGAAGHPHRLDTPASRMRTP